MLVPYVKLYMKSLVLINLKHLYLSVPQMSDPCSLKMVVMYISICVCCRVYDRFHVVQCFHCQGFGHFAKDCLAVRSHEPSTCVKCSGTHNVKNCTSADHKCINCVRAKISNNIDHPASDFKCPVMQYERRMLEKRTDYSVSKN
jgi:hypothetical protein